jgi:hypothetical protein
MALIEFFGNETNAAPITAEPVVYCTREDARIALFNELLRQRHEEELRNLGQTHDVVHPDEGPQPTGGHQGQSRELAVVDERISAQDAAAHQHRRAKRSREADQSLVEDEELKSDAERKFRRLGVREHVVHPGQSLAATMLLQQGEQQDRTRITGKGGTTRGHSRRDTRGLLHVGNLLSDPVQPTGKLGPKKTVVHRSHEHNVGSRVIA